MKNGKIVEVYTKFNGKLGYEPLDTMNTCNIIAGDWEIVNEKSQDYVKKSHNAEENEPKSEKNLTEQWKKGELDEGFYYLKDNKYTFIDYFNGVSFKETCDFEIKEVLAEVPDYIEWKNYVNGYCEEHKYNLKLSAENQRLKSLLKECREVVEFTKTIVNKHTWFDKILIKINGALK